MHEGEGNTSSLRIKLTCHLCRAAQELWGTWWYVGHTLFQKQRIQQRRESRWRVAWEYWAAIKSWGKFYCYSGFHGYHIDCQCMNSQKGQLGIKFLCLSCHWICFPADTVDHEDGTGHQSWDNVSQKDENGSVDLLLPKNFDLKQR